MEYNKILCIKRCGNVDGVDYVYGRYNHFVPNCENVLIVGNIIFPIHDNSKEDIEDIVREIVCRQKKLLNNI